jgi:hypothetical protein
MGYNAFNCCCEALGFRHAGLVCIARRYERLFRCGRDIVNVLIVYGTTEGQTRKLPHARQRIFARAGTKSSY